MMKTSTIVHFLHVAAVFSFSPSSYPLRPNRPFLTSTRSAVEDKNTDFLNWATSSGVVAPDVEVAVLAGGVRGVRALTALEANKPFITVPAKLTLETTSLSRVLPASVPADYINGDSWAASTWYLRLAVMLLRERDLGSESALQPWIAALPNLSDFKDLPLYWSDAEKEALQYTPILEAIDAQREEYTNSFDAVSVGKFDLESFEWALHNVRSRAFSGSFEGTTFKDRVLQAGFTVVLASGALLSQAVEPLQVVNGVLAVALTTLLRDFLTSSQGELKRFCLCPTVDMLNHRGGTSSDVAYEYFTDNFAVNVGRSFEKGEEVLISYGTRSNDQLLQFYGFIEQENADDQYEVRGMLELLDEALVPPGRLQLLQDANLLDFVRTGVATQGGFVDQTTQAVRALVATEKEVRESGGVAALANAAGIAAGLTGSQALDRRVSACLSAMCKAELSRLPTTLKEDVAALENGSKKAATTWKATSERERLALQYRIGKKRVLQRCASALQATS